MRNIFLEKPYTECGGETIPRPFSKTSKLWISHGTSPPPPFLPLLILEGDLKISDQTNWGGGLSKKINLEVS